MFPDSSSASSPFSTRSTLASSPEVTVPNHYEPQRHGYKLSNGGEMMQGMDALLANFANRPRSTISSSATDYSHDDPSPKSPLDIKPNISAFTTTHPTHAPIHTVTSASASTTGSTHHGGTRSEPPKRLIEVEGLPVRNLSLEQLSTSKQILLLQGDPQYIHKQRVETAIRVILDLLRLIPPSPSAPEPHPSLARLLPRDGNNKLLATFDRPNTFRALRLQMGATTKASSKKQLQAGPTPKEHLLYLETAVYMSGENGKRVYVCKRCRSREKRRREHKDASRKKQSNSESDSSTRPTPPRQTTIPPSSDYITGENPDQYDPHKNGQVVEEPVWDPNTSDWRHEIVLFNSAPEVTIKEGSCMWLPFRVVCYGKCHGEKLGFRIKFTLRAYDGRIISESMTSPIRITDDHKTDSKVKPKIEAITSTGNAAVPRHRRSRPSTISVTSSRRQSPVPSDAESVQSLSEAGALLQKQTPSMRASKPYERPPPQSPLTGTLPMDSFMSMDSSTFRRQHSSTSIQSMSGLQLQNEPLTMPPTSAEPPVFGQKPNGTVSPGILRHPNFSNGGPNGFTTRDGSGNYPTSGRHSTASSSVASPVSPRRQLSSDDVLFGNSQSPNDLMSMLAQAQLLSPQLSRGPMLSGNPGEEVDMNAITQGFDSMLDSSSHTSLASSYQDDASGFSMFSNSGLVPETLQEDEFLDFSGGQDQILAAPVFAQNINAMGFSQSANSFDFGGSTAFSPSSQVAQDQQIDDMLASIATQPLGQVPRPQPPPAHVSSAPQPSIHTVIPAEGGMAGGDTIAIIGANFAPGITIMFGDRIARIEEVLPTFVKVRSPPAVQPGTVEVTVQGIQRPLGFPACLFKYNLGDSDLMRLALEVRDQYQGSSSDAAYRLATHFAARSGSVSEYSGSSPSGSNPSPRDNTSPQSHQAVRKPTEDDLQTTVINFLASIDENAPGSLRRSGAVNHRNDARHTLLHIATVMGFHRLVRRLVVIGAHLDLQDVNGFTPLSLATLAGRTACLRVLIEAGAAYDYPTAFGEMPLDLAKISEHADIEALLLSAVWSTEPEPDGLEFEASSQSVETSSEIDDDNPSSGSEDEVSNLARARKSKNSRGKQRAVTPPRRVSPSLRRASTASRTDSTTTPTIAPVLADAPPPYDGHRPVEPNTSSWMSRTLSNIPHPPGLPEAVLGRLPLPSTLFRPEKHSTNSAPPHGWVAFPAPSWEMLQKMASPEEVKLFTQAMAAAAFNAVVQSGATTSSSTGRYKSDAGRLASTEERSGRKTRSGGGHKRKSSSPGEQVVRPVKHDRMLYLFWLPILLFVGFWLLVTALPIATGFCLIYARQITRAIKQKM
ncbi:hypothetical protein BCR39DRAFT_338135 [Naematelia encephala]|uniref:Uncharacterized protein n=1 Tax=Naematelia encephala TaxID=71784 RepID=A0A1Y2AND0_9TREE|nr:hypothetical protein BCR39DRAFT_338135 [Naematelia encephala]